MKKMNKKSSCGCSGKCGCHGKINTYKYELICEYRNELDTTTFSSIYLSDILEAKTLDEAYSKALDQTVKINEMNSDFAYRLCGIERIA